MAKYFRLKIMLFSFTRRLLYERIFLHEKKDAIMEGSMIGDSERNNFQIASTYNRREDSESK